MLNPSPQPLLSIALHCVTLRYTTLHFSWAKDFNRQKLEEAIAALLVLPCPQNLLIQRASLDRLPVNALPIDSLLLVARHLGESSLTFSVGASVAIHITADVCLYSVLHACAEALGESCVDENKLFFTAHSLRDKGLAQVRNWSYHYPLGTCTAYCDVTTVWSSGGVTAVCASYGIYLA